MLHPPSAAGKLCYAVVTADGLSGIAVCDKEYPARVAVGMLKEVVTEMTTGENA